MWFSMAVMACGEMAAEATIGICSEYGCSRSSRVSSARDSCSSIRVATGVISGAISDWTVMAVSDSEQDDPPAAPDPRPAPPGAAWDWPAHRTGADDCVADNDAALPAQARSESSPGQRRRLFSHCYRIRVRRGAEGVFRGLRGEPHKALRDFELAVFGAQTFK